jgi:hypothetical protein
MTPLSVTTHRTVNEHNRNTFSIIGEIYVQISKSYARQIILLGGNSLFSGSFSSLPIS